MAQLPEAVFIEAVEQLVRIDRAWIPGGEGSLYLRPFMIASEVFLGVKPSAEYIFAVIASPVGSYFKGGPAPVSIWVSENYTRAAIGGTGAVKCGGNYAASLRAQAEAIDHGCDQVVFLDAVERRYVEELGGMNIFFVFDDGSLLTPPLGTILPGITRDSIIALAKDAGKRVREEPYTIDQWRADAASGKLKEAFACGTAAVISPIGKVCSAQRRFPHQRRRRRPRRHGAAQAAGRHPVRPHQRSAQLDQKGLSGGGMSFAASIASTAVQLDHAARRRGRVVARVRAEDRSGSVPSQIKERAMGISFDNIDGHIWYDGRLVPWKEANVHVLTHGLHYASACSRASAPMAAGSSRSHEHSERLKKSARILDFEIPYSVAEIDAAKQLVIDSNNLPDAYVRPIAWRGSEMMGVSAQTNTIHLAIAAWQWPSYFDPASELKGIRLDLAEYRRPDPRTDSGAGQGRRPLHDLHDLQAQGGAQRLCRRHDAGLAGPRRRMHRRQHLLRQGRQDPHADRRLLPRRHHPPTVIDLAKRRGIEVVERRIMPDELAGFSECFLTGTAAEVTPVSEIAHWTFTPATISEQLMRTTPPKCSRRWPARRQAA